MLQWSILHSYRNNKKGNSVLEFRKHGSNMNYAGFWRRFAALFIDGCIMALIYMILMIVPFFPLLFWTLITGFYHVAFETSPLRGTPGKAIMKIAVVKSNGSMLTIKDSIIRFAVSFVSSALLCFGYLISLFTGKRQTFHDIVADTVVIEEVFASNNYWDIFITRSKEIFNSQKHPIDNDPNTFKTTSYERPVSTQSLEELYNLHQKGILTDEEYKTKKEEYLKRL